MDKTSQIQAKLFFDWLYRRDSLDPKREDDLISRAEIRKANLRLITKDLSLITKDLGLITREEEDEKATRRELLPRQRDEERLQISEVFFEEDSSSSEED